MSSFSFSLLLVLVFNSSSHLVMSKKDSLLTPDHHHSSQIVNFSASTSPVNELKQQNSSSSYSLSQLQTQFQVALSSSAAASPKIIGIHASEPSTKSSDQTSGSNESGDDGHGGMKNFNDLIVSIPADSMSLPQPSTKLSKSRYRRGVPSFWSFLVSDTSRETAERQRTRKRRSLSTKKPKNYGILQASNSNLSFVQDQQKLLLKLDRNYTPKDIAEYTLSTGDERGIIHVVADMVQDGQLMASRDDVILFLETVQRELNKLKALDQFHRPSPST